ncbi:hypothetical protein KUTeg_022331 [Tegillarca granosa]|uniref:Calcium channel flower n=1 Tax=Tegillarca granosa TaxID=220873 RepID=A0ABQ9EAA5_TEGGR|nr:hypothetical protein KUTeg_022331 [Tegillarca granosa]
MSNITSPTLDKKDDGVAWWFKFLTRGVGTIGGIVAMATGVVSCITLTPICLIAGVIQILIGFVAVMLEAPCCCQFIDFADKIGKFSEERPYWQKGTLYVIISLFPILMCIGLSTVLGSGLVFVTGVLYGLMVLGKKADRETMLSRASKDDIELQTTLITNEEKVDLHVPDSQSGGGK